MSLLWPGLLLLLGIIPLLIGVYVWRLRRRSKFAVRYSSLTLVRAALPRPSFIRRHLPFALFLLALTSLLVGLARPVSIAHVPVVQTTVILAMDVSRSMCAVDIPPNRLEAAKDAALSFVRSQPDGLQIGVVAFAGFAELVQPPTTDTRLLEDAIKRLTTGRRTAIGSAILRSLDAIAEINNTGSTTQNESSQSFIPRTGGDYKPDIIVLLTDGASNSGIYPIEAALLAAERGIRVYTIGFGTPGGGDMYCQDDPFFGSGPTGGRGGGFLMEIDEVTLMDIADMTGGTYYSATSASELNEVFRELPNNLVLREEITEVSFAFAALGALLAVAAVGLSMRWSPVF